jgi:hypothetical protein
VASQIIGPAHRWCQSHKSLDQLSHSHESLGQLLDRRPPLTVGAWPDICDPVREWPEICGPVRVWPEICGPAALVKDVTHQFGGKVTEQWNLSVFHGTDAASLRAARDRHGDRGGRESGGVEFRAPRARMARHSLRRMARHFAHGAANVWPYAHGVANVWPFSHWLANLWT